MCPAGESAKMPVKDHQEPIALVILKRMQSAVTVTYGEWFRGLACQITHRCTSIYFCF
jgi:hypothetical protein